MIRLLGILTGSAVAVACLIVALGVPEFSAPEPMATTEPALAALAEPAPESIPDSIPESIPEPIPESIPEPIPESIPESNPQPEPLATATLEQSEPHWYAFWSPFRSEIAADGFVSELQRTTGLDYRVVKLKPGVYEVAFAYYDDSDIQQKLTQISSATGLDLSGG